MTSLTIRKCGLGPLAAAVAASVALGCSNGPQLEAPHLERQSALAASKDPQKEARAFRIKMQVAGEAQEMILSEDGAVTRTVGTDGAVTFSSSVDYLTEHVLAKNYADLTYTATTLDALIADKHAASAQFTGTAAVPAGASLHRTRLEGKISRIHVRAYAGTVSGHASRLWYADELPRPPLSVRRKLESISAPAAKGTQASGGSPDGGVATEHRQEHDHWDRETHDDEGTRGHDDDDEVRPGEIAGRTVLRVETRNASGQWTTTIDTSEITRIPVDREPFTIPPDWTVTERTSSPTSVSPAFDTESVACKADDTPLITPVVNQAHGPLIKHAKVYVNYLGAHFADAHAKDPAGFDSVFTAGAAQVFDPSYFSGLAQYGMRSGQVVRTRFLPSLQALNIQTNPVTDVTTVEELMLMGAVPMFWWKVGASDPLVVLVADATEDSRTPYHMAAPSPTALLPFPSNLFAYDFIPYAFTSFPRAAIEVTAAQVAARDAADCSPSTMSDVDTGTVTMSHEVVEALTDPYPFFSWFNPTLFPAWLHGEIGDICQIGCNNLSENQRYTRVGNAVLTTYWSNAASDCVGGPRRPSLKIVRPVAGDISEAVGGTVVTADVSISDSIYRGACAGAQVVWSVDGQIVRYGAPLELPIGGVGPHTISARFRDETGNSAEDSVLVKVVDVTTGGPVCTGDPVDSCQCFSSPRACGITGNGCTAGSQDCVGDNWSACTGNTCAPFAVSDTPHRACGPNIAPQDCYYWETVCDVGYHIVSCGCENGQDHGFCSLFSKAGRLGELHTHVSGGFYATTTAHLTNCSCIRDGF